MATRTETLLQAQNDVAQRGDDLKRIVYADRTSVLWTRPLLPTTPLPGIDDGRPLPLWEDAYQTALARRPELRNFRLDVDSARITLTRAQSQRLHGLDLELSVTSGAVDENFSQAFTDTTEFQFPRCLLYTSPSPRDQRGSRMPSSA